MRVNTFFITLGLHSSSLLLVRRIVFSFLFVEQDIPLTTPGVFSGVLYWYRDRRWPDIPSPHFTSTTKKAASYRLHHPASRPPE
jgi:hypothetical protein